MIQNIGSLKLTNKHELTYTYWLAFEAVEEKELQNVYQAHVNKYV